MKKIIVLWIITTLWAGCTRKNEEATSGVPPSGEKAENTFIQDPRSIPEEDGQAALENETQRIRLTKPQESPEPLFLTKNNKNYLFLSQKTEKNYPADYKIGQLASKEEGGKILDTADSFFKTLTKGIVDRSKIADESLSAVESYLTFGISKKYIPRSYRLGKISTPSETEARMNIRLFADPGRAEGELYLVKSGGDWLIRDVRINLEDLTRPYDAPEEHFYPSSYYWDLEHSSSGGT